MLGLSLLVLQTEGCCVSKDRSLRVKGCLLLRLGSIWN